MTLGVGYDDDLNKAKQIIEDLLAADERVLKDPVATIAVANLGDSSVEFVIRPWVNSADYWAVKFDFTKAVKERFDSEGISIPYPQSDVHVFQESLHKPLSFWRTSILNSQRKLAVYYWFVRSDLSDFYYSEHSI